MDTTLLLSGGVDSACLAALLRPARTIFIDYGQRAARAEARASSAIARQLDLLHVAVTIDMSPVGSGLLAGAARADTPSPEWWPFRNQALVSIAAAWVCSNTDILRTADTSEIVIGCVQGDGDRHVDGSAEFIDALSALVSLQEGGITVRAPAIGMSTEELVTVSSIGDDVLAWTHSCHVADLPCGNCPGCFKRERVLVGLERLQ
jgi:7-cyano-7-deazaguanine synthase